MAFSEICLQRVAGRPWVVNPYRHRIYSVARTDRFRLYATAPQNKSGLVSSQNLGAVVPKSKPEIKTAAPKQDPSISSNVPNRSRYASPNVSIQSQKLSPNTAKQGPTSELVQRKPRQGSASELLDRKPLFKYTTPPPSHPAEKKAGYYLLRLRLAFGFFVVGSIIYAMTSATFSSLTEGPSIVERDKISKHESGITSNSPMRLRMEEFVKSAQSEIVSALESLDPTHKFRTDAWTREAGGEGISRVLQNGKVFEKAGVNTSIVYGTLPRAAIEKMRVNHKAIAPNAESLEFFAAGLSLVLHPQNPMVPTVHLNYRYFETIDAEGGCTAWFGGGTDLTPSYLFDEDVIHFHRTIKDACDKHDPDYYPRFKEWCDRYFRIPHREETRGVGGIFFDDLDTTEKDPEQLFSFIKDCASAFLPSYIPTVHKRKDMLFTEHEKEWQQLRRGRYVEFNLVNDRGTQFGLQTPSARVESILMSLPLTARWMYMHEPEKGSREERLLGVLKKPAKWIGSDAD